MRSLESPVRSRINKATTSTMNPVWKSLVEVNATSHMDTRVLAKGARIASGNPPTAIAANSTRKIGRLTPAEDFAGWEFGAERNAYSTYERRSPKGTVHTVRRRTQRHLPPRTPKGRVVYPAFAEIAPRMVSLWLQIIVKTVYDAAEGKGAN